MKISKGHNSATRYPIKFAFGSGTAYRMAPFSVGSNPRWRPDGALAAYILTVLTRHGVHDTSGPSRLLCNKDPFTLRSMQRLVRLFPHSRFVLMIRDGRAVADSIVSGHVTIRGFDVETHRGALGDWNRAMSTWRHIVELWVTGTAPCRPCFHSAWRSLSNDVFRSTTNSWYSNHENSFRG